MKPRASIHRARGACKSVPAVLDGVPSPVTARSDVKPLQSNDCVGVSEHRLIVRHFGERDRLGKLFRQLGTDNAHEAEATRGRIDSLLREFGKSWNDLIELLAGKPFALRADLAGYIVGLGVNDSNERADARRNISDLLAGHRKNWNDLAHATEVTARGGKTKPPSIHYATMIKKKLLALPVSDLAANGCVLFPGAAGRRSKPPSISLHAGVSPSCRFPG
jgi:hypothetical protein